MRDREQRLAYVIGGVMEQAIAEARATGIVLLGDGSPEALLAERLLRPRLRDHLSVFTVAGTGTAELVAAAAEAARSRPDALLAHAVNKTAALFGGAGPVPLLPLADLWGTQVEALENACSLPDRVQAVADAAGGIAALDAALQQWVDGRRPADTALAALPAQARGMILSLWEDTSFYLRRVGLVPKLGLRTLGVDLFD